jgi:hypothetical protein
MSAKRTTGAFMLALVISALTLGLSLVQTANLRADVKHESVEAECTQQGCYRIKCYVGGEEYCIPSTSCYC